MPRLLWLPIVAAAACGGADEFEEGPVAAFEAFVTAMEASPADPAELERAYRLLGPRSRAALETRAQRAEILVHRPVVPWRMLARGSFRVGWRPVALEAEVDGRSGSLAALGPNGERARIAVVREEGRWKIEALASAENM